MVSALAAAGAGFAAWQARSFSHRNMTIAVLVCVAATAASIALRVHAVSTGPTAALAARGATVTAEITLTNDPKIRRSKTAYFTRDSVIAEATLESLRTGRQRMAVHTPIVVFANGSEWRDLLPSQRLRVSGRLSAPTSGQLTAAVLLVRGPPRILTPASWIQTAAGAFRQGLRRAADVLPPDQRGLLPALVVGDVSRIDQQVNSNLQEAGLSHLNAVSGANLAIVAGAALALSRLAGLPLAPRAAFAALAMLAFAIVARPSPSVLRALLMGLVAAAALGTGRAKDGMAALSVTVLLLILFAPELARSYGFALSVAATAGILLLAPRWRTRLTGSTPTPSDSTPTPSDNGSPTPDIPPSPSHRHTRPPNPAPTPSDSGTPAPGVDSSGPRRRTRLSGSDLSTSGNGSPAAGILALASRWRDHLTGSDPADTPTTAGMPGEARLPASGQPVGEARRRLRLPRWAAEAVAVPAAAQAAVTPVLVLMSGEVSLIAVPANLLAGVAVAPATLLGFVAALIAPFWPEAAQVLVIPAGYAVGWIIMVAQWAANVPMANLPWPAGLAGLGLLVVVVAVAVPVMRRRAWRTIALTVGGAALAAMLVLRPIVAPWPPPGWLMVMCDVGQGDGLVIAAGPQQGVVVDAGPDPSIMDACLRRIGIRDVPLVILTHPHADHVDGLTGVLRHRRVGAVLTSPYQESPPQSAHFTADLARRRIPTWTAHPGTRWRFGPSELTVLAPDPANVRADGQGEGSAANNSSVVIHVRWPTGSALLSGDIESEAQEDLLRGPLSQADILKVPHHGSPRQVPAFFHAINPRAALVSVGADNGYGHPAPKTLAALRHLGARIYRTDTSGDLAIVTTDAGLAVVARGSRAR